MTGPRPPEPSEFGPEDARAADAFRASFAAHAEDAEFRPLDPEQLRLLAGIRAQSDAVGAPGTPTRPTSAPTETGAGVGGPRAASVSLLSDRRRRRPLLAGLAAAVVLVIGVPLGLSVISQQGSGVSSAAGSAAGPVAPVGQAESVPQGRTAGDARTTPASGPAPADSSASGSGGTGSVGTPTQAPPAGTRWVTIRDVAVAVPASWGSGLAPDNPWPWCAPLPDGTGFPKEPYVADAPVPSPVPSVLCPGGGVPEDLQVEHLEWHDAAPATVDGDATSNGWVYTSRTVGSVRLTYVHRPGVDADAILGTARLVVSAASASATPSR